MFNTCFLSIKILNTNLVCSQTLDGATFLRISAKFDVLIEYPMEIIKVSSIHARKTCFKLVYIDYNTQSFAKLVTFRQS